MKKVFGLTRLACFIVVLMTSKVVNASDTSEKSFFFEVSPLGLRELSVGSEWVDGEPGESSSSASLGYGARLGFRFFGNWDVGLGLSDYDGFDLVEFATFGLADEFSYSSTEIFLGYSIPISENMSLVPRVGMELWELDAKSSVDLFNIETRRYVKKSKGEDPFFEIGIDFFRSKLLGFNIGYLRSFNDFGKTNEIGVGIQLNF